MIIATHCYQFFSWTLHPAVEAVFKDTFDNSSLIFIFIAGFLFQYTEEYRFFYKGYLFRKLKNVLAPFAIAMIPAIAYASLTGQGAFAAEPLREFSVVFKILYDLVYPGQTMNFALWFMPVIAIYYIAAPLLITFDRRRSYWVLAVLLPLSVLMHRPTYSHGHNLSLAVYFLSSYVLGMWFSRYWKATSAWLERNMAPISIVFGLIFIGHLILSSHHGKSTTPEPFQTQGSEGLIDWIYLQKILMVIVFLGISHSLRARSARVLDYLAGASFTIFFYHFYFIYAFSRFTHFSTIEFRPDYFLILFSLAIGAPCAMVFGARKFFPSWSRTLVGASVEGAPRKYVA